MRFSELDGRHIGVWGAGAETRSFAGWAQRSLPRARIEVVVLEEPPADGAPELTEAGARVVDATRAVEALGGCDVVVRSPGVSIHRPELRALTAAGVPVTTATGLWLAERRGRGVIGITGTKGKSTTATMTAHLLAAAGFPAQLAGNIGRPALDLLEQPEALVVLELSSYQIADLPAGPETAVVINLFREHADWHGGEAGYRRDKLRLLSLAQVRRCVVGATFPAIADAPCAEGAERFEFGTADRWHVRDDGAVARGQELRVATGELPLPGAHNAANLCAALTVLDALRVPVPALPAALSGLTALPHRLQLVHQADGVSWVDDSISTTPESAIAALESYPEARVALIGGGSDRGQDHRELAARLTARGATVIGMPDTGARLVADARAAGTPAERALLVHDLPAAVAAAGAALRDGGVVLLSPAAPSYHAYRNYIARGEHFLALARSRGG